MNTYATTLRNAAEYINEHGWAQATRCCLAALAARHLIGHRLFTQADYDFLTIPIRVVLGPIHPDDKDQP